MTTPFALLAGLCGLSQREAAAFLEVRPDTVKSWSSGRNRAPAAVPGELAALAARIDRAAGEAVATVAGLAAREGARPGVVELGEAADDHEARSLGWPCAGAHRAVLARVVAALVDAGYEVAIVPRGSTPATAGAADAHGR